MKLATAGQLIRILGLMCEMLGLAGIWMVSSRGEDAVPAFLGQNPDWIFKVIVVCGFALWLIGRTMISMFRRRDLDRARRSIDDQGENDLRL